MFEIQAWYSRPHAAAPQCQTRLKPGDACGVIKGAYTQDPLVQIPVE